MSQHQISRRTMLRGLGVSMALPWLESVRVWGDTATTSAAAAKFPAFVCTSARAVAGAGSPGAIFWARLRFLIASSFSAQPLPVPFWWPESLPAATQPRAR